MQELTGLLNEALANVDASHLKSNADLVVLTWLSLDGPQRPRDLLQPTGLTSGGLTNLLDRLEAGGLVERSREVEEDGRGVLVTLTADGTEVIQRIARSVRSAVAVAGPLLETWRQEFVAMGLDVGAIPSSAGSMRRQLERIRRVARVGRAFWTLYEPVFGADDPTPNHTFHLLWLAAKPGGVRPRAVGAATRLSAAGVTDLITRVEERGLITRLACSDDRRAVVVTATPAGRAAIESLLSAAAPMMQSFADAFFPT